MFNFVRYLNKSQNASMKDCKAFNSWEKCEIDIQECIRQFRKNNRIDTIVIILPHEFETWLNCLGYYRGINDESK